MFRISTPFRHALKLSALVLLLQGAVACSSDSDDNGTGYVKFFNASSNSPAIYFTIDDDLDTSEDDAIEITFSSAEYGEATSAKELENGDYYYEIAWKDGTSSSREELELIDQQSFAIRTDSIHLITMTDNVQSPTVSHYDIAVIDDEDDDTYDLFNLRVLNLHNQIEGIDVYISEDDETFNEAQLIGSYAYLELSDNVKYDQGSYVFYITQSGSDDVLYTSTEISFAYAAQYVMTVRENLGAGGSPYVLDRISTSAVQSFEDVNARAQLSVYNAIAQTDLLAEYDGIFDLYLNGYDQSPEIDALHYGELSNTITLDKGDYALDLRTGANDTLLLRNQLLNLPENSNKTVFFYKDEENVDDDGDGDVDENDDGIVDEIDVNVYSLVVENSYRIGVYDHSINLINLVDSDEFSTISSYFVKSNETISSASSVISANFATSKSLTLLNNTYQVYITAKEKSSDVILASFELVLDENAKAQFLIVENDESSATGFKYTLVNQPTLLADE